MDRRLFLATASATLGAAALPRRPPAIEAVLFDAFPIFSPRAVAAQAATMVPDRADALLTAWRTRQFEYTWLRTTAHRYQNFWDTTASALTAASRALGLGLTASQQATLMEAFLQLEPWPDVPATIHALKTAGLQIGFLSNFTAAMLEANLARAGLRSSFDHILTTDLAGYFKPAPEAYQLGLTATALPRDRIAFVAFAGWDAVGAKWFGYPTVWVNRLEGPTEELGATPDATGPDLRTLVRFVTGA